MQYSSSVDVRLMEYCRLWLKAARVTLRYYQRVPGIVDMVTGKSVNVVVAS
jgi:hypothetical protein